MSCSVYKLTFPNGKLYIGVSQNPRKRLNSHACAKSLVGRAVRKHGKPRLDVLLIAERGYCYKMEAGLTRAYNTVVPHGYNMRPGGHGGAGAKRTPEQNHRNSEGQRGKTLSEATKEKLREIARDRPPISEVTRAKMQATRRENRQPISEATRVKLRAAQRNRAPITEETRKRISEAAKRRGTPRRDTKSGRLAR